MVVTAKNTVDKIQLSYHCDLAMERRLYAQASHSTVQTNTEHWMSLMGRLCNVFKCDYNVKFMRSQDLLGHSS